jgi:hypothetical protein
MAWGDTGGGYTWQGNIGGKDRYSPIVPANREARMNRLARQGRNLGGGRSIVDAPNWAAAHPTRSFGFDRAGAARGDLEDYGKNYRNIELANRRGLGSLDRDQGMGLFGHIKGALGIGQDDEERTGGGFNMPFPSGIGYTGMLFDSMAKNQAQHKDLDRYFQATAGDNWRKAKDLSFFDKQGFLDAAQTGNIGLLSKQGRQAYGRFNRAGITDNSLEKFMDPSYKFYGNEAWLRAQADGDKSHFFDEGMSFLKNARDTAELHRGFMRGQRASAAEENLGGPLTPTGGPISITDNQFAPGYDQELPAYSDETFSDPDDITDDITGDITFGGNERFEEQLAAEQPLPWEAQRQQAIFRNRPQGVRGMLGYGMEFDRMAYPYGEDFQDEVDEFWDINPSSGRMVPYS